jgi:hypothetical protein
VRAGKAVAGYWAVDVRKAGRYTIELRRWPAETGYALSAGAKVVVLFVCVKDPLT